MRWIIRLLWPVMALLLSGCLELGRHWDDQAETRQVDYYKEQCDTDSTSLCFRIREESDDSWGVVEETFSGFSEFAWGNRYVVNVTVSFDEDGDPSRYRFDSIASTEAVSDSEETFALTLYTDTGILYAVDDTNWNLASEIDFACNSACDELTAAVANGYVAQLEFSVDGAGGITLDNILCAAAEDDFDSSCEGSSSVSWYIGWFQSECGLAEAAMCLVYKVNSSDDFELLQLDDGIDGFTPVWGEQPYIDVIKTTSDGGSITAVELDNDDSSPDDRLGSSYDFKIIVRGSELSKSSGGSISVYDSAPNLDCSSFSQCSDLDNAIDDDKWLLLDGYYDGTDIVVTDLTCSNATLATFRTDCVAKHEDVNWSI
ncbi:hypothetical protein [Oceanobacter antarcticus]|uniref:DUF4377 domain-containing protein n=1 Tax=Oceanobacter antarcticus TaxID=3133425 RepID=A0ABW8NH58_9GAMM